MTRESQIRRFVFTMFVLLFFVVVLVATNNFRLRVVGYFPGFAALLGLVTVGLLVVVEAKKLLATRALATTGVTAADGAPVIESQPGALVVDADAGEGGHIDPHHLRRTLLWLMFAVASVGLLGLLLGAGLFLLLFLRFEGRESWTYTVVATAVALGFLYGTADLFGLQWPESIIVILFL